MIYEHEDGRISIYDWKRCKEIKWKASRKKFKTEVISHLPDSILALFITIKYI